ncbi:MAG: two-component system, OmpR family, sensor kinase [Actinomycetota bacterium]|nr:two-component system, OmpR family, sensor kinase [Actinomycetota bacterium]
MSLRVRLLAASLALLVFGLLAADLATYTALRSFLLGRVDNQLLGAQRSVAFALSAPSGEFTDNTLRSLGSVAPGVFVQVLAQDGAPLPNATFEGRRPDEPSSSPKLPANVAKLAPAAPTSGSGGGSPGPGHHERPAVPTRLLTVPAAEKGGPQYRVSLTTLSGSSLLVVALPLSDTFDTLHRLVFVELLVSLAVLGAAAALGFWLVRIGLRPLADIEASAATITAGDFDHRVARVDDSTEVGRLGKALNAMLATIATAFSKQQASEEAARRSEQRLRRFVADASHELRTPVAAVRAYAELYRRGADTRPEDLARLLSRIELEAARMGVLVDDLLLLTRLDEGRPLGREPVDLGAVVSEAVAAAQVVEPDRVLTLHGDGLIEVLGDRDRLRQVVDNLLGNVRSHTPAGSPADISVRVNEGRAQVEVADRGPGLPPDELGRVFERFYRADEGRSRDDGGTGLGLSIVSAIVASHGGRVGAAPRQGGGTVFIVELPLYQEPGDDQAQADQAEADQVDQAER